MQDLDFLEGASSFSGGMVRSILARDATAVRHLRSRWRELGFTSSPSEMTDNAIIGAVERAVEEKRWQARYVPKAKQAINHHLFVGDAGTANLLAARGFDKLSGDRSGGISDPRQVYVPAGSKIVRLYYTKELGDWWSTLYELSLLEQYFARGDTTFSDGRASGRGILHGTLGVRQDWLENKKDWPRQLSLFWIARLIHPLIGYYGEGYDAPKARKPKYPDDESARKKDKQEEKESGQPDIIKIPRIIEGGGQRKVRQLYLPDALSYSSAFSRIAGGRTDHDLLPMLNNAVRLPFE